MLLVGCIWRWSSSQGEMKGVKSSRKVLSILLVTNSSRWFHSVHVCLEHAWPTAISIGVSQLLTPPSCPVSTVSYLDLESFWSLSVLLPVLLSLGHLLVMRLRFLVLPGLVVWGAVLVLAMLARGRTCLSSPVPLGQGNCWQGVWPFCLAEVLHALERMENDL